MTDVDYTVSTAVSISKTLLTVTAACPYVTATLTGSDSDWADALTDCTSCTDLDGYKIEVIQTVYFAAFSNAASFDSLGGCLATATTASAICLTARVNYHAGWCEDSRTTATTATNANCNALVANTGAAGVSCSATMASDGSTATSGTDICSWNTGYRLGAGAAGWATTTIFAAAVGTAGSALPTTTALTVAGMNVASTNACTGTTFGTSAATCDLAASVTIMPTTTGATAAASTFTTSWYQPNEDSEGYTTTMPRFSAEDDTVHFYGFNALAAGPTYALADCGSGILMGASTLLAGAAVAFGAAALAL